MIPAAGRAGYHRWRTIRAGVETWEIPGGFGRGGRSAWQWLGVCRRCNMLRRGQEYWMRPGIDPYFIRRGPRPGPRCGRIYEVRPDAEVRDYALGLTSPFKGGATSCAHRRLVYFGRNEGVRCARPTCGATWARVRRDNGGGSELRRLEEDPLLVSENRPLENSA